MPDKPRVLVLIDWFEPGSKAGGPIRSIANFARHLKDDLDIYILTGDRDLGDAEAYPGIDLDTWLGMDGFHVRYLPPRQQTWGHMLQVIKEAEPDRIYLNSMYSTRFAVFPMLMRYAGSVHTDLVLAPRGMLRSSAIAKKKTAKVLFLNLLRLMGVHRRITFQATDPTELTDIKKVFGSKAKVELVSNLPVFRKDFVAPPRKDVGKLRVVFVGRVHPIKNLDLLLDAVQMSAGEVVLTVIAPVEDKRYWAICQDKIAKLRPGVTVVHHNSLPHDKIEKELLDNHIFALPTKGENFGHAILEAMALGRPVLISDQTPWRELERAKAGWDLSSETAGAYATVLDKVSGMNEEQLLEWCRGAWAFYGSKLDIAELKKGYYKLFG